LEQSIATQRGATRIHVDDVEGLGHFLELEVVLEPGEDENAGVKEAETLMGRLGVLESTGTLQSPSHA